MVVKLPSPEKEADIQIQVSQGVPNKINPNGLTPKCIIIKVARVKKRILKAAGEKQRAI